MESDDADRISLEHVGDRQHLFFGEFHIFHYIFIYHFLQNKKGIRKGAAHCVQSLRRQIFFLACMCTESVVEPRQSIDCQTVVVRFTAEVGFAPFTLHDVVDGTLLAHWTVAVAVVSDNSRRFEVHPIASISFMHF